MYQCSNLISSSFPSLWEHLGPINGLFLPPFTYFIHIGIGIVQKFTEMHLFLLNVFSCFLTLLLKLILNRKSSNSLRKRRNCLLDCKSMYENAIQIEYCVDHITFLVTDVIVWFPSRFLLKVESIPDPLLPE